MKFAVIVFPGSNCDLDMYYAVKDVIGEEVAYVRHDTSDLSAYDGILLPGGFSYGDYLRAGAIARFAPVMKAVAQEAEKGKLVLGVCNGFQILLEAGLLKGAMLPNASLSFRCFYTPLVVRNTTTPFTRHYKENQTISLPIAHGEGNYFCDHTTLEELKKNGQIVFEYSNNPNGSVSNIAGIVNKQGNVLGMMPHPERAVDKLLGSDDGKGLFESLVVSWKERCVHA